MQFDHVQLIVRTTRKLVLTEAGQRVYESAARIAGDVEAAKESATQDSTHVAGLLRVTAPGALGSNYLVPVIAEFMQRHPQVSFDLVMSDSYVDLVADRIDLALRVGSSAETSLISRRIARVEFLIAAAPSYLAAHGTPRTPPDLAKHTWIMHTPSSAGLRVTVRKGTRRATVDLHGKLSCNDGPTNLEAARRGLGMLAVPDFEAARYVHDGSLARVLPAWKVDDASLHLVFPPRRHVLARVRAFADFVAERFRDPPWRCSTARNA
jgi:DNA-binding transcriptional LysR family regulator